jgi:hypothetical protein
MISIATPLVYRIEPKEMLAFAFRCLSTRIE